MELSEFIFEAMCEASYDVDRKKKNTTRLVRAIKLSELSRSF